jgi:pimeloyl-ACP methyl ester carboxylesterase
MSAQIHPYRLEIEEVELSDLRARLARTRWPDREPVDDWSQGAPLENVQALVAHWRDAYDWRGCEAALNAHNPHITEIDGVDIFFLHVRSKYENALPLILTHGWPGSVVEFLKVIGPLTDPEAHGGDAKDAFHLILPSLPGYGFSGKPREPGWGAGRIGKAWATLMQRLGYTRYVAQGGDWGAAVTTAMGVQRPTGLAAIHVNMPLVIPKDTPNPTPAETRALAQLAQYSKWENAYAIQNMTRPQTLGYALADSPVGQAAWIYEKFHAWTDHSGAPETIFSHDELLDNIMLYWLTNSAASSARLYWESFRAGFRAVELDIPAGASVFPKDIYTAPRAWAERCWRRLIYWNELERGGHFAAFEQPALFVDEVRKCFRLIR